MKTWRKLVAAALLACCSCTAALANAYVDFFRAINIDNVGVVNQLLARGFDPNAANEQGQVALYLALRDEAPRVLAVLLAHPQIKVDLANASGETPLMMAALKGNLQGTQRLIERGAQINREGWTPLHYAASNGQEDSTAVVKLLLDRGAPVDARAPNGNTPLMMAARYGAFRSAELLLARGADRRLRNNAGMTAAELARLEGRDSLAERLSPAAR
ncbi:MAG TPA: ankyrin repeat domain-containing protein [Rubrivivax sp.]|nr:ankyrin repeat domain-containing protein [Rubrivivax sp.]